jgi:hypothetical protein
LARLAIGDLIIRLDLIRWVIASANG